MNIFLSSTILWPAVLIERSSESTARHNFAPSTAEFSEKQSAWISRRQLHENPAFNPLAFA